MLVCGNCTRRGKKNTIVSVNGVWRYKITSSPNNQLIFTLDEEILMPEVLTEYTSLLRYHCARCGNDFFIPPAWIKKGRINMSEDTNIYDLKRLPVCVNCRNEEVFIFYGHLPQNIKLNGRTWSMSKIYSDTGECMSDRESVKIICRALIDGDDTIPIQCKKCFSHDIDLVPVKNDFSMTQHDFDKNYMAT